MKYLVILTLWSFTSGAIASSQSICTRLMKVNSMTVDAVKAGAKLSRQSHRDLEAAFFEALNQSQIRYEQITNVSYVGLANGRVPFHSFLLATADGGSVNLKVPIQAEPLGKSYDSYIEALSKIAAAGTLHSPARMAHYLKGDLWLSKLDGNNILAIEYVPGDRRNISDIFVFTVTKIDGETKTINVDLEELGPGWS